MNKNSINEVAKTYQRLVEAANMKVMPSDESNVQSVSNATNDIDTRDESSPTYLQGLQYEYNSLTDQLANCLDTGNCSQAVINSLMERIREITNILRGTGY